MSFSRNRFPDFLFGGVFTAGLLACMASLMPYVARLHWFLELFTHFRLQIALCLLAASLLTLFSRHKKLSLIFSAFLCLNLIEIAPFYFPDDHDGGAGLKVVLVNVNSSSGNPERVLKYLQSAEADLIVMQEFSFRWRGLQQELQESYPHQAAEVREDNFGMILFSKRPFISEEIFYFSDDLPSMGVEIMHEDQKVFLLATHPMPPIGARNAERRNRQLTAVAQFLADSSGPVILTGDLNTSPWSPVFKDVLKISGLRNSMRGFGIQPTWPSQMPLLRIPLDHLLHSGHFAVSDRKTAPAVGSDHFPVEVTLQFF